MYAFPEIQVQVIAGEFPIYVWKAVTYDPIDSTRQCYAIVAASSYRNQHGIAERDANVPASDKESLLAIR